MSGDTPSELPTDVPAPVATGRPRWVAGLRRAWTTSHALERWVDDRGVTGAVWAPGTYETDDLGRVLGSLTAAGAKPDKTLLWDLAVPDIADAADELHDVYDTSGSDDGYVAVWLDPSTLGDPERAIKAAAQVIGDVRRANVAIAFAWTPQRAAVLEALVRNDCPVALSGVRDDQARSAVVTSRTKAMEARRFEMRKDDPEKDVPEVPVFLLGATPGGGRGVSPDVEGADHVRAVDLVSEFELFGDRGPAPRPPNAPDAEASALTAALERLTARAKRGETDDTFTPEYVARNVYAECAELQEDELLEDIWARDHTVWNEDPSDVADRLGWLDVAERMHDEAKDIASFAGRTRKAVDAKHVVLLGMGGSSLGAETFARMLSPGLPLTVLDTTHPDHIAAVTSQLDLARTIFVVGSKSGTTIETRAHLEYFWSIAGDDAAARFVAITDPGSELAALATERNFARVFENPPDIGGRYSALSYFGLVPAALAGVDVEPVIASARRAMVANAPGVNASDAPAARLAAAIAECARKDGRDKLTLVGSAAMGPLGPWIEQLIAESTGKDGKGVLPVVGEPLGSPDVYGGDRIFVVYSVSGEDLPPQLEALEDHPVVRIRVGDVRGVGAEMFRWELATAIVGYELDINPFDQPDVEAAKVRAREALRGVVGPDAGDARPMLEGLEPPRYIAIQAFIPPTDDNARRIEAVRVKLRDRYRVAVTTGFGPRFLHSTGQYHKGGPASGVFLQVTDTPTTDIDVPGMDLSFGKLIAAQADGDLKALRDLGRDAARLSLDELERLPS
jgi:glucose-6-phosphate isomerase